MAKFSNKDLKIIVADDVGEEMRELLGQYAPPSSLIPANEKEEEEEEKKKKVEDGSLTKREKELDKKNAEECCHDPQSL